MVPRGERAKFNYIMKWLFLINNAQFLMEFLGEFAHQVIEEGDECIGVISSKIAEYEKKKYFPAKMKFISKIDWCIENYQKDKKEFGGLSWREVFFAFDRFKQSDFDYDNSLEKVLQIYQFFEFIFGQEKPNAVVSESPSDLFNGIAYYFCQMNKKPYLGLIASRFKDRIEIYDLETTCSKYKKTFREINNNNIPNEEKQFAKNFIEKLISHQEPPFYIGSEKVYFTQIGFIKHYLRRIKEVGSPYFQYFLKSRHFKEFDYESKALFKNAFLAPFRAERRKFRILSQKRYFKSLTNLDNNQKFFLFPLHYQPESSVSVQATYYSDQLNTIKNIAFALPLPYKLYVKEHPTAVGTKSRSFYKELEQLPNVVLISVHESVENLIKKSSGVITLTNTIGMEAVLSGKPAYVLGNVFYSYHPLCRKVKNFEELKDRIQEDLINKPRIDNLENINYRFIISYFRNTIKGDILSVSKGKDNNDYKVIYQDIVKKFLYGA